MGWKKDRESNVNVVDMIKGERSKTGEKRYSENQIVSNPEGIIRSLGLTLSAMGSHQRVLNRDMI